MKTLGKIRELILESVDILVPKGLLSIPRHHMPQIEKKNYPEYFDLLSLRGIKVTRMHLPANKLRVAQEDIDLEKVFKWSRSMPKGAQEKPCIVSRDLYVMDGNHSFLAIYNRSKNAKVDCYVVDLEIQELINISRFFNKVTYKTVKEELNGIF